MPPKNQPQALGDIKKPSGNSLAAFKTPAQPAPDLTVSKSISPPKAKKRKAKQKVGRPAKPEAKKESATVILKMTEAEKQILLDKAGITPLGTWFKHFLKTETNIFK